MRFNVLDSFRGICALMVAIGHLSVVNNIYQIPIFTNFGYYVDFFFVLSGFVIASSYSTRLGNLKNCIYFMMLRFGRLYPIHLLFIAFFVLLELARFYFDGYFGGVSGDAFSGDKAPLTLFKDLTLTQSIGLFAGESWNSPSWSISTEFYTYVLFSLAVVIGKKYFIYFPILAVIVIFPLLYDGDALEIWRCVYSFSLGILIYKIYNSKQLFTNLEGRLERIIFSSMEAVLLLCTILYISYPITFMTSDPYIGIIFSAVIFVFAFEKGILSDFLKCKPFIFLGAISYSIYMSHVFIVDLLVIAVQLVEKYFVVTLHTTTGESWLIGTSPVAGDFISIIYLLTVVVISACLYRWVEVPGRQWARDRFSIK